MKTLGLRVALIEPGIIDTAMAQRISAPTAEPLYPQVTRMGGLFVESLKNPFPPSEVAARILDVAASGTWTLRHPVGPDSVPLIGWRSKFTDEEWVDAHTADDAKFYAAASRIRG